MKTKIAIATVAVALGVATNAQATSGGFKYWNYQGIYCVGIPQLGGTVACGRNSNPNGVRIAISANGSVMVMVGKKITYSR